MLYTSRISFLNAFLVIVLAASLTACDGFLDYDPKGAVSGKQLESAERVDQLVTAAYAELGNDYWLYPHSNPWPYGNVRADDAYKGGGGISDQRDTTTTSASPSSGPIRPRAIRCGLSCTWASPGPMRH